MSISFVASEHNSHVKYLTFSIFKRLCFAFNTIEMFSSMV